VVRAFINKSDNTVAFLEIGESKIHSSMLTNEDIFLVEIDEKCFEGVNSDEWHSMFYDKKNNILYLDDHHISLSSERGKQWLIEQFRQYALVPPNARGIEYDQLLSIATNYISQEKITEIMSDGVLSDDEVQDILGYLNAD